MRIFLFSYKSQYEMVPVRGNKNGEGIPKSPHEETQFGGNIVI